LHIKTSTEKTPISAKLELFKHQADIAGVSATIKQLTPEDDSVGKMICAYAQENQIDLIFIGRRRLLGI
jgi:nucleotide-binding universal stress UspA family protein